VVLDRKAVCDQVGGDEKLLREIAGIFLEEYHGLCSRLRDAIDHQDAEALMRNAHALKESVASITAPTAFQAASSLETLGRNREFHQAHELLDRLELEMERIRAELENLVSRNGSCSETEAERNSSAFTDK
jgi:HPt (histidine-containing phosphotransfer) domain-containing protein